MKNGDKGVNRIGERISFFFSFSFFMFNEFSFLPKKKKKKKKKTRISFFLDKIITLTFFYYARINTKFITRFLQINITF